MIPKYSITLLRSCSNWLESRSKTLWATDFGHASLMIGYAKDLEQLAVHLQGDTPTCKHCSGLIGAPLGRDVHELDCVCILQTLEPVLTVDEKTLRDLAATVRRLANRVHKYNPHDPLIHPSLDFLDRIGQKPNILRKD